MANGIPHDSGAADSPVYPDFNRAQQAACRLARREDFEDKLVTGLAILGIFGIIAIDTKYIYFSGDAPRPPAITRTGGNAPRPSVTPLMIGDVPLFPVITLTVGGYTAEGLDPSSWTWELQDGYLREKADFIAMMKTCAQENVSCNPRVKAFADMIERTRAVPDKIKQVELVNAWVNMIPYSDREAKKIEKSRGDPQYHTMTEALTAGFVCKEAAELKLLALELLGFSHKDVFWLSERHYVDGVEQEVGHAVTLVRIDGKFWVINLAPPSVAPGIIAYKQALSVTHEGSEIESAAAQINLSGQSMEDTAADVFLPYVAFNSQVHLTFDTRQNDKLDRAAIPAAARDAPAETAALNLSDPDDARLAETIMASAFAPHYRIVGRPFRAHSHSYVKTTYGPLR